MARRKGANKNRMTLILRVNDEEKQVAVFDNRKYELINYYLQQKNDSSGNDFMDILVSGIEKSISKEIEKQNKKNVPTAVRDMYEGFLSKSAFFGGEPENESDKLSAVIPTAAEDKSYVKDSNGEGE